MNDSQNTHSYDQDQKRNSSIGRTPPSREDRLAVYSMLTGGVGILFTCCFPSGAAFGIFGIVLALMSRSASEAKEKRFNQQAVVGIILSVVALLLTCFLCYAFVQYFSVLKAFRDPVIGPQMREENPQLYNVLMQVENMFRLYYSQ